MPWDINDYISEMLFIKSTMILGCWELEEFYGNGTVLWAMQPTGSMEPTPDPRVSLP